MEKVIICGIPFRLMMRERDGSNDMNMGISNTKDTIIAIDNEMSKEQKEATLVHEWVHCVLNMNGINHEEVLVGVLGTELYRAGFRVKKSK